MPSWLISVLALVGLAPGRCRCGHPRAAHEHYRPGTDCGLCGIASGWPPESVTIRHCPRYRPTWRRA